MQQVASNGTEGCNKFGRVKPGRAAEILGLQRSTMKRYLDRNPELRDADGLVDLEALKAHRADNPAVAGEAGPLMAAAAAPKGEGQGRRSNKQRIEEIRRLEAERDWALSIGTLVDPSQIIDAVTEAGATLRDRLMAPDYVLCERLAEERDPRAIQAVLREINRALLDDVIAALGRIAKQPVTDAPG